MERMVFFSILGWILVFGDGQPLHDTCQEEQVQKVLNVLRSELNQHRQRIEQMVTDKLNEFERNIKGEIGLKMETQFNQTRKELQSISQDTREAGLYLAEEISSRDVTSLHVIKYLELISPDPNRLVYVKDFDCAAILNKNPWNKDRNGIYNITLSNQNKAVFCDMTTNKGGWTVIQRRTDGSENFYRNWIDYKNGFGSANGEYWIGNDILYELTSQMTMELRVDMQSFSGETAYVVYSSFYVGDEASKYRLLVEGPQGGAGDSLDYINNRTFSTHDQDNERCNSHCANLYKSGWWFTCCTTSNPNGLYSSQERYNYEEDIVWSSWIFRKSLKSIQMMIRPRVDVFFAEGDDCADILEKKPKNKGKNGVHYIQDFFNQNKAVFCDMTTSDGGWTVIQRRIDSRENFYRNWTDYKEGFGNADEEYWIGNEMLHRLTSRKTMELRVDMQSFSGETAHVVYSSFYVGDEASKYRLQVKVEGNTGNAGDSLSYINNRTFSTHDKDNERCKCASSYRSGWWFTCCTTSNPNGLYSNQERYDYREDIVWSSWIFRKSLKSIQMMIRPRA